MRGFRLVIVSIVAALGACATAPAPTAPAPSIEGFSDAINHWRNRYGGGYPTYAPTQVREIADNVLLYQRDNGGWIENRDPTRILNAEEIAAITAEKTAAAFSFDNRNIYSQVAYLMGAYEHTGDARYRDGAERGLDRIFAAQIPACGGWPHTVPATNSYHDKLTMADEVTSGTLTMLRQASTGAPPFARLDRIRRNQAAAALARGDECLLRLQVRQRGRLTGWAGQYDPATLAPLGGRTFELASIVSQETVSVTRYLMSIPDPSPETIAAIDAAVSWLRDSEIRGYRMVETPLAEPVRYEYHTARFDRALVADPAAPPLWARFYDLADNSVVLANRDGVRVATYAEIHPERRSGYSWYGTWAQGLLETDYPAWRARTR